MNSDNILIVIIGSFLMAILSFFKGCSYEQQKQMKKRLNRIKEARKIEKENSKLTRDELIDKL